MGRLVLDATAGPQVWAGPECAFLDVAPHAWDQLALTGHDTRADDIERLRDLGARAVRYPVLWGRDRGGGGSTDWSWAERRIEAICAADMVPIVGLLHHGYGPRGSDPLDPGWPAAFAAFARDVAVRLPASVFLPINEPLTTSRFGALYGWWPPYALDAEIFADLLLAHASAIRSASQAIRQVRPGAQIIVNEDGGRTEGEACLRDTIERHDARRWLTFDLLTGRVRPGHPWWSELAGTSRRRRILDQLREEPALPDVLGIDYYVTSDRYLAPSSDAGASRGSLRDMTDVELSRVAGGEVGFGRPIRETWERYGLPVALTEVHLAGDSADQVAWWSEAWTAALEAAADGIPVTGVTAWAAFGAVDWSSLLCRSDGDYARGCFDVQGPVPRLTPLGRAVAASSSHRAAPAPLGWWRSNDRVTFRQQVDRRRGRVVA